MFKNNFGRGFTLIEIAWVIVIVGLLIAAGVELYSIQWRQKQQQVMDDRFSNIQTALHGYVANKGHYPCPASYESPVNTAEFGRASDCSDASISVGTCSGGVCISDDFGRRVRTGALPIRDLNLSVDDMTDIYGNRFSYAVTEQLAVNQTLFDGLGAIDIVDGGGHTVLSSAGTAHFVVFSHGMDGVGAYSLQGGLAGSSCATGAKDNENCDKDAVFRSSEFSTSMGTERFDDYLRHTMQISPINVACPAGKVMQEIRNDNPVCIDFQDIVANVLGSFSCPSGQGVVSFSSAGMPECGALSATPECTACGTCGDNRVTDSGSLECEQVCTVGGWANVRCWDSGASED